MTTTSTSSERAHIQAVVFDAYGTLVEITDARRPYRQMMNFVCSSSESSSSFARDVMTSALDLKAAAARYSDRISSDLLAELQADLVAELASIRLYPDVPAILADLTKRGIKIGICSNLAMPYARKVLELIPAHVDATSWSFEVGAIKPEPAIYAHVCSRLELPSEAVLMIGDREAEDFQGPIDFGMKACLLDRNSIYQGAASISTLSTLIQRISMFGNG